MSTETRVTLLLGQLKDGLKYDILKGPAVSGALTYQGLCLAVKNEEKRQAELWKHVQYKKDSLHKPAEKKPALPKAFKKKPASQIAMKQPPPQLEKSTVQNKGREFAITVACMAIFLETARQPRKRVVTRVRDLVELCLTLELLTRSQLFLTTLEPTCTLIVKSVWLISKTRAVMTLCPCDS